MVSDYSKEVFIPEGKWRRAGPGGKGRWDAGQWEIWREGNLQSGCIKMNSRVIIVPQITNSKHVTWCPCFPNFEERGWLVFKV